MELFVPEYYPNYTAAGLMIQWVRDHRGIYDATAIHSLMNTFIICDNEIYEFDCVTWEFKDGDETVGVMFRVKRVDEIRSERIIAGSVELL